MEKEMIHALVLFALLSNYAFTYSQEQAVNSDSRAEFFRKSMAQHFLDPVNNSSISSPMPQVTFIANKDESKVVANIGIKQASDFSLNFKLSGPITQSQAEARPVCLDGLTNSGVIDLGAKFRFWKPKIDLARMKKVDDAFRQTDYYKQEQERKGKPPVLTYLNVKETKDAQLLHAFENAVNWGRPFFVEVRLKLGKQSFDFADTLSSSFQELNLHGNNVGLEISSGLLTKDDIYFGGSLKVDRVFREGQVNEFIVPLNNGIQLIKKTAIAEPQRKTTKRLQFEIRKLFSEKFAIRPTFTFLFENRTSSVEVPFYFFQHKDGGLNGGAVMGWRSDTKEFTASILVGEILTIIP